MNVYVGIALTKTIDIDFSFDHSNNAIKHYIVNNEVGLIHSKKKMKWV